MPRSSGFSSRLLTREQQLELQRNQLVRRVEELEEALRSLLKKITDKNTDEKIFEWSELQPLQQLLNPPSGEVSRGRSRR